MVTPDTLNEARLTNALTAPVASNDAEPLGGGGVLGDGATVLRFSSIRVALMTPATTVPLTSTVAPLLRPATVPSSISAVLASTFCPATKKFDRLTKALITPLISA